jgi:hypothetical protein
MQAGDKITYIGKNGELESNKEYTIQKIYRERNITWIKLEEHSTNWYYTKERFKLKIQLTDKIQALKKLIK